MIDPKLRAFYYIALCDGACTIIDSDDEADCVIGEILDNIDGSLISSPYMKDRKYRWRDLALAGLIKKICEEYKE